MENLALLPSSETDARHLRTQASRRERHRLRRWLHAHSSINSVRGCGFALGSNRVGVNLGRRANGTMTAAAAGIATCNSVWSCPVCSAKVSAERGHYLLDGFNAWRKSSGGGLVFATFTLRHSYAQPLAEVWDGLGDAWRGFLGGSGWVKMQSKYGLAGWVRQVEVTHGANGWHVHLHIAFFVRHAETVTDEWTARLRADLIDRWRNSLSRIGFEADANAQDVRRTFSDSGLAAYMNKSTYQLDKNMAAELTASHAKNARGTSRTPFAILADLSERETEPVCRCATRDINGTPTVVRRCDLCLWREWELASAGRKQQGWSNNLRDYLNELIENLEADPSEGEDDAIVEAWEVLRFEAKTWRTLVTRNMQTTLYDLLERYGPGVAMGYLERHGIAYLRGHDIDDLPACFFRETPRTTVA